MEAFEALRIGNVTVKNRLAVPPMVCYHWTGGDGYVTQRTLDHYEAFAEGGFGLVIVEATAVTKRSRLHETELGLWEDGQVAGFAEIVRRVHAHGAKIFVQLVHAGIHGIDPEAETASDLPERNGITGHEMSVQRIRETTEDFVAAALRAKAAGVDGIEIHGCHGYLLSQFMNSRLNFRADAYGRDRTLFAKEVLTAVRAAVPDLTVGIRLGVFEPKLEDGILHARELAPYTNFLDLSYGGDCDPEKPVGFPCSAAVYGASRVKALLPDMPVFAVDHINSAEDVKNVLALGIDVADIGRAALVDPAFARHVLNGENAGRCLYCASCRWRPTGMKDPARKCAGAELFKR